MLDSEVPNLGQAMNQGCLLLVLGLGQLSERYRVHLSWVMLVLETVEKSKPWAKTKHAYGKVTGNCWEPFRWFQKL